MRRLIEIEKFPCKELHQAIFRFKVQNRMNLKNAVYFLPKIPPSPQIPPASAADALMLACTLVKFSIIEANYAKLRKSKMAWKVKFREITQILKLQASVDHCAA